MASASRARPLPSAVRTTRCTAPAMPVTWQSWSLRRRWKASSTMRRPMRMCSARSWSDSSPIRYIVLSVRSSRTLRRMPVSSAVRGALIVIPSPSAAMAPILGAGDARRDLAPRGADHVEDSVHHVHQIEVLGREDRLHAERAERAHVALGDDAAHDDGDRLAHPFGPELLAHRARDLEVRAGEDREAEHGRILLDRRLDDLRHRPADTAVDHLEAGLAGRDRDHLRAVRVAVEPGLADDDPGTTPVPGAPRSHARPHRLDARALEAEALALDAGRRAVLAEHLAQRIGPLAGRDPGARAGDRGGHQVLARPGGLVEAPESRVDLALAPPALGGAHHLEGLGGRRGVELEEPAVRAGEQGRGQPLGPAVAADDHELALVDVRQALGLAAHQGGLHVARLDRGERAAQLADAGDLGGGGLLQLRDLGGDHRRAVEQVGVLEEVRLVGEDLLQAERPLLVPRARQAERLVPGGELEGAAAGAAAERHA